MPYLNRAIAKETLGVEAAQRGDSQGAQALWRSAAEDASRAIELDPKEFAAWFDRWEAWVSACFLSRGGGAGCGPLQTGVRHLLPVEVCLQPCARTARRPILARHLPPTLPVCLADDATVLLLQGQHRHAAE